MQVKNPKVLGILQDWENQDWKIDLASTPRFGPRQPFWDINDYDEVAQSSTSDQYIEQIIAGAEARYYSVTNIFSDEPYGKYIFDNMPFDYDNAYTSMYNPKGFVGWHHDLHHVDSWLMLMSYCPKGDGFYKDYNHSSGTVTRTDDNPGWNFRSNHVGTEDNLYWHCAFAPSPRYTWLFGFESEKKYNKASEFLLKKG